MSYLSQHVWALTKTVIEMPTPTLVNGVPQNWTPSSVTTTAAGFFVIAMGPAGAAKTDVTYYRGVPTKLESFTSIDPFSYGTAVINFPQITGFDDLDGLGFLGTEDNPADVDIYWYAAAPGTDFRNPVTGAVDLTYGAPTKLWEGFVASREMAGDEAGSYLQVQCQGALFQADYYKQKPFYPRRPYVMERLIYEILYPYYDPAHPFGKPHLRTLPVTTRWPAGYTKSTPERGPDEPNIYTPVIPPNRLWTGLITRYTGGWESTLTGYIQDLLAVLYVPEDAGTGVTSGNQFTLRCEEGRAPVLEVRDRNRTPDFELWFGTPGLTVRVTEDYTQIENSMYGEGTGIDGVTWRNAFITGAWNRTDYDPLAHTAPVYPPTPAGETNGNPNYDENVMVHETKATFGTGMDLADAISAAEKRLEMYAVAGLSGTMTLKCDPAAMHRFHIRAGMTVKLKGINGSGATGINFHIAEVVTNLTAGIVECRIDTKYRDLLTLEEVAARNIDPLTPSKLLQVNKRSNVIEDVLAPWDYHMGSGYIPMTARHGANKKAGIPRENFFDGMAKNLRFPWESWTRANPPSAYTDEIANYGYTQGPYVKVKAGIGSAGNPGRWSVVPVLTSQKGTIRRIEVACYDAAGNVLAIPFHLSFYHNHPYPPQYFMPQTGGNYSPFTEGHFESYSATGVPTDLQKPPETFIIGWGNFEQRAGHSPGMYSKGFPATGLFTDESPWNYDNSLPEYEGWDELAASEGEDQPQEAITLYAAFYADHTTDVYFLGRMYRQHQEG